MYVIKFTDEAKDDLRYFNKAQQAGILDVIEEQLQHEPAVETKNRKKLRANVIANYELRAGDVRVFYHVYADENVVDIVAIGWKEHNQLFIKGQQVQL